MELIDERTQRVLAYVDALNRHGAYPTSAEVDAFGEAPDRRMGQTYPNYGVGRTAWLAQAMLAVAQFSTTTEDESWTEYLDRLSWVRTRPGGGLEITTVGRALLRFASTPPVLDGADDFEFVVRPDDPFAYARVVDNIARVPDAFLVEPYLRAEQFMTLAEVGTITRYMVNDRINAKDRALLALAVQAVPEEVRPEVRLTAETHDRYLFPSDEAAAALMLGVSLNGVGRTFSTMTALPPATTEILRREYEAIWSGAKALAELDALENSATAEKPAEKAAAKKEVAKKAPARDADQS